ncbi:hypothetical protein E2542_SST23071 [Spatholobus suberectus]|nr:hypothetical protein E2542_SST23071 [Spatholobus suberectus]
MPHNAETCCRGAVMMAFNDFIIVDMNYQFHTFTVLLIYTVSCFPVICDMKLIRHKLFEMVQHMVFFELPLGMPGSSSMLIYLDGN